MTGWIDMLSHELRLLWREGVAFPGLAVMVLLLIAAAINGRALVGVQTKTAEALTRDAQSLKSALSAQAERGVATARAPGAIGFSVLAEPAVLPASALGAFAVGQSDLLAPSYLVTARGEHTFMGKTEIDNPLRLSIGNFDVAFVVIWLLPLIVIALSFNVISAERESGVLALATAAGASPARFILSKLAARVAIAVLTLWVALGVAAYIAGAELSSAQGLITLLLWLAASTLYAAFWFALALFVNSRSYASDQNASVLAGAWLALVIVAPALTNLAATTLFPAPSRVALTTELREATELADRAAAADRDRYFFDHPQMQGGDMDTTAYYLSVARSEAQIAAAMSPLFLTFDRQAERQRQLVQALQYLSPGTLTYQLFTSLAGTDGQRHQRFRAQTSQFHERWVSVFTSRLERSALLGRADYEALPKFRFEETPIRPFEAALMSPLAMLTAISALLLFFSIRRLRHFPLV